MQKVKKSLRNEESLRNLSENMKHDNICFKGLPEGEENEQGIKNLFEEIMTTNFPNLVKRIHKSRAQRVSNKLEPN